jgi:hypothetical protein
VTIPLGKDHLPAAHVENSALELEPGTRVYGKGIIDEAGHWTAPRHATANANNADLEAPSEMSETDSASGSSSESSRLDASTLFFVKSDKILLGAYSCFCVMLFLTHCAVDDNADMRHVRTALPFLET